MIHKKYTGDIRKLTKAHDRPKDCGMLMWRNAPVTTAGYFHELYWQVMRRMWPWMTKDLLAEITCLMAIKFSEDDDA